MGNLRAKNYKIVLKFTTDKIITSNNLLLINLSTLLIHAPVHFGFK